MNNNFGQIFALYGIFLQDLPCSTFSAADLSVYFDFYCDIFSSVYIVILILMSSTL